MGRMSIRLFVLKIKRFTAYFSAQVTRKASNKEEMNRSIEFIKASNLLGPKRLPTVAIVDVRDDERSSDGHIAGSLHFCSETFNVNMPRLVHATNGKDTLVFHCAFSQIRGPRCARTFADYLSQTVDKDNAGIKRIMVLENGYNGWKGAGHPVCYCTEAFCKSYTEPGNQSIAKP
ncbi:unnamed protein product [Cuscuta europaea]|uniref:arsenate reductase (glutathione/glutaredoxin) n=1 Tax=Cuscuta europaea TaxID=41803 RepID=A0A9P0Z832_CUSEU|nr:unnamed protein product [Cuscuta europaea]